MDRFGEEVAQKAVTSLVEAIEGLGQFPEKGIQISKMYRIDTEYYYLFFEHNYIVYRFNDKEVTILRLYVSMSKSILPRIKHGIIGSKNRSL